MISCSFASSFSTSVPFILMSFHSGVLEKYVVLTVHTVSCHCLLFRMPQSNVLMMLCN
jgi:hypothetical protein